LKKEADIPVDGPHEIAFGPFLLDHRKGELTNRGVAVPLGRRALEVLTVLAGAAGRAVSKEALLSQVWPGVNVEENNVQVQISLLRKALGKAWIATIPGTGYRLTHPISNAIRGPNPAVTDKPSLVVLPFQNISGDPEQEYFVDGLVEDITTALSCIRSLFVIARSSAFTYKGRAMDVRQVGRDLGVRYVLEGSVRRSGSRVRITGQLLNAATGAHLWANRFDGTIDDVFGLQDRVTEAVAGAVEPHLQRAEIERVRCASTHVPDAYDCYLRGMAILHEGSGDAARSAYNLFTKATEMDPTYGAAYGLAAFSAGRMKSSGLLAPSAPEIADGMRVARLAAQTGRDDPAALCYAAMPLSVLGSDPRAGARLVDRACALNPNSAMAWYVSGQTRNYLGETTVAITHFQRAMRLSPVDPLFHQFLGGLAQALNQEGRSDEAVIVAERAVGEQPNHSATRRSLAAAYAFVGRIEEARQVMTDVLRLAPRMRTSRITEWAGPHQPEYLARLAQAYRLAGMPE
jgi:TolB-like protein